MLACLLTAFGCSTPSSDQAGAYKAPTTSSEKVALAVALSAEITADPDNAEQVLVDRGMTVDQLDDLMSDIAADADMSDAYAAARGK